MISVELAPMFGLDQEFPEDLFVLHHVSTDRYGCYHSDGTHGLACFSTENGAIRFAEWIDLGGMTITSVTFDEAREIAKKRPMPVNSLMLLDNINDPMVHYVK